MFISFKLFSLLHTHHFSCHGVLSTGDWHLIHESENSLPENLDGLQTEILSLQVSQGTWKYLLDAYPLRIGAQFNTAQNCVYFVDHVFAASRLFRFPTRIPSFSCLSATHATCINRTNGPVAVAQTDRTKHRQTLGGRGLKARPLMLCRRLAGISVEGNGMSSGELSLPLVRKAYIIANVLCRLVIWGQGQTRLISSTKSTQPTLICMFLRQPPPLLSADGRGRP